MRARQPPLAAHGPPAPRSAHASLPGVCFLMMKTVERAHTPRKLWEKVKLSKQYGAALEQIDKHLTFWPKFLVHKNKQRLTKITQYLIRCRKLAKQIRPELITMPAKLEKREARREVKAEVAARLESSIESELLARLKSGTYNEIYNFPTKEYAKVLDANAEPDEVDEEEEEDEEEDGEGDEEQVEFVEGYDDLEDEEEDLEDYAFGRFDEEAEEEEEPPAKGGKRKAARPAAAKPGRVVKRGGAGGGAGRGSREIEYEREREPRMRE